MPENAGQEVQALAINKRRLFTLFPRDVPTRVTLLFFAVVVQLIASAISGVGYSARAPAYWLAGMFIWVVWFFLMFVIVTPRTDAFIERRRGWLTRWAVVVFYGVLIAGIAEVLILIFFAPGYVKSGAANNFAKSLEQMEHGFQYNDGTALVHQATENLLDGKNPYANANIVEAFTKFNGAYDRVTPLRTGRFADAFPYPAQEQFKQVWDAAVQNPSTPPPEIESRVCYPSGSFLLPAPFIAAGMTDMRVVYFIFVLGGLIYTAWQIRGRKRLVFIALAAISLELWNIIAIGETGTMIFPFLLIAWISLGRHNWLSTIFMGLAVASKQTAWFFLPFYLILLWRVSGRKAVGISLGVIAAIFVAANAYFIAMDPKLWLESVVSPMTDTMFPLGVGLVSLVIGGFVDIQSSLPFAVLECLVFIGAVAWYFRYSRRYPYAGLVLAVLPMFFAWRSLWCYFFYVTIIICAGMLIGDDDVRSNPAIWQGVK